MTGHALTSVACGVLAIAAFAPEVTAWEPGGGRKAEMRTAQNKEPERGKAPQSALNTLNDVVAALRGCWIPPPLDQSRPGMQITVQLSFKRSGEILGRPRITFETAGASDDERLAYRVAVAEALKRCSPLPFTEALGNAVAGRPFNMRFIDERKLKRAEHAHD